MGHVSVPEPVAGWAGGRSAPGAAAELAAGTIGALFREHHGELVRLALLMMGDLATAEDVVQDVYANSMRGAPGSRRTMLRCPMSGPPC